MTCDELNNACRKLFAGEKTTINGRREKMTRDEIIANRPIDNDITIEDKTMNNDQWKNRSNKMVCKSCMWFVLKVLENDKPNCLGRCRRHAPIMSGWPAVFETDWCGDHKLNENAVE